MHTNVSWKPSLFVVLAFFNIDLAFGQSDSLGFWDIPSTLQKDRFWVAAGAGTAIYAGALVGLNHLWYEDYPRTSFHFFNDGAEWQQMDKAGHMFTAYFESDWVYHVARWTGMNRKSSIWTGAAVAVGLQTTFEVLDGFSSKWGFSVYDCVANVAGAGFWAFQQATWDEQRIRLKVSSTQITYPEEVLYGTPSGMTTIRERTDDLYGTTFLQTFLKDYNAQTIWASVNIHSFLKDENHFPKWLNIAVGYSGANMFGGFENKWEVEGNTFQTDDARYPRFRQFALSPDIDLTKIKTKSKPLKVLLGMANVFKIPAPALLINGKGGVKWDWIYY